MKKILLVFGIFLFFGCSEENLVEPEQIAVLADTDYIVLGTPNGSCFVCGKRPLPDLEVGYEIISEYIYSLNFFPCSGNVHSDGTVHVKACSNGANGLTIWSQLMVYCAGASHEFDYWLGGYICQKKCTFNDVSKGTVQVKLQGPTGGQALFWSKVIIASNSISKN